MKTRNIELSVVKAIGILSVVSCHLSVNIFNIIGIPISSTKEVFPGYSYNMPLFIFASGYFYKTLYEKNIIEFLKKRFSSIKKYFKCNIFYFLLCLILVNLGVFSRQIDFSFKSVIEEPFLGGFQFYFNGPGWFVLFLLLLQITYIILRKIIWRKDSEESLKKEIAFLFGLFISGIISVYLCNSYPVVDENIDLCHSILRVTFGISFFQLGFIYKKFISQKLEYNIKSFIYIVFCKIIFNYIFGNSTFSLRILQFNGHVILPYVYAVLGISYILYLSHFFIYLCRKVNEKLLSIACFIGDNTWSIMMHHLLVKWCMNKVYKLIFISSVAKLIGTYFISPILCIVLPLTFTYLYNIAIDREAISKVKSTLSNKIANYI